MKFHHQTITKSHLLVNLFRYKEIICIFIISSSCLQKINAISDSATPTDSTSYQRQENTYEWRRFGSTPVSMRCQYCQKYIRTHCKTTPGPLGNVLNCIYNPIKLNLLFNNE